VSARTHWALGIRYALLALTGPSFAPALHAPAAPDRRRGCSARESGLSANPDAFRASLSSTLLVAWECIFESHQHCHSYRHVIDVRAWNLGFLVSYPPLKHINMLADVEEEFLRLAVQWRSIVAI